MSSYQVLVERASDGFFSATVIGVPECTADGSTKEESLKNASARLKERLARGELFTIEGPPLRQLIPRWRFMAACATIRHSMTSCPKAIGQINRAHAMK